MAFTSYVTVEEAQDYINVFHNGSVVDLPALTRASYALDRIFRDRFIGTKTDIAQEHEWPRGGSTVIPDAVIQAVIELAVGEEKFDAYAVKPGIVSESVTVGDITESITYKPGTVFQTSALNVVETILGGHVTASGAGGGITFARIAKSF